MTRTEDLSYLSRRAHAEALAKSEPTPAEWPELMHLPMWREAGVPYFDGTRMRPDQIEDAIERLERYLGVKARQQPTIDAVRDFLLSYAKWGVRINEVVTQTGVSRSSAQNALRMFEEQGFITIKEEPTRGPKGTPRKRYYLADNYHTASNETAMTADLAAAGLHLDSKMPTDGDTGIRHHGTAVQALTCGCSACGWAFEEAVAATLRSDARRRGDRSAAFAAGLDIRRMRRERQVEADREAIRAAGGWVP